MTVHLIKLCVGIDSIDHLREVQDMRRAAGAPLRHITRNRPRREGEILDGGSIYWVIKRMVRVRQRILGFETLEDEDGRTRCAILLDPELVPTELQPRRPHQGWRYLEAADAPKDAPVSGPEAEAMPEEMAVELKNLGLL